MANPTMLTYIHQEQATMLKILAAYPKAADQALQNLPEGADSWLMLGIGSSYNAALSAKHYMEKIAGLRIVLEQPYNYTHYEQIDPHLKVVLGISQSGQSTSTIEAINRFKDRPVLTIGVTSAPTKELGQATANTLDIGIGHERVGYVTLGFTATVLNLMLLGLRAGVKRGVVTPAQEQAELAEFTTMANTIDTIVAATTAFFQQHEADFKAAYQFTGIAYGPSVGSIKEMETKFSETVRIPSDGQELEAFMHGPYLEINDEHRLIFVETPADAETLSKAQALRAYESTYTKHVFGISYLANAQPAANTLTLPAVADEMKIPFVGGIPFQVLAWLSTKARGIDLAHQIFTDFSDKVGSKTVLQQYV